MSFLSRPWMPLPPEKWPQRLVGTIAIDTETRDEFLKIKGAGWATGDGEIVGISMSCDNFTGYFPVAHKAGGNLDKEKVFNYVQYQLSHSTQDKVFANAQYDVGWLNHHGIRVEGDLHDVIVGAALLDELRGKGNYSLNSIAKDYIGEEKDETLLKEQAKKQGLDPKKDLWKMHAEYVGPYAEQDSRATRKIWNVMKPRLLGLDDLGSTKPKHPKLWSLYRLEMDLVPMLIDMRKRGVRIDFDKAEQLTRFFKEEENNCISKVKHLTGFTIDPWVATTIIPIIEASGIKIPLTPKTKKPSVTAGFLDSLEEIEGLGPAMQLVLRARKMQKARSTFSEGLVDKYSTNGRVHCSFHQLPSDEGGAVSGRLSCTMPNLQNQPSPDKDPEIGLAIRSIYLPEEGESWASLDYSQQEPRLTVHYAYLLKLPGAEIAVDRYNNDPDTDYHSFVAELTGLPRKRAKNINLGLAYGMGLLKLCKELGLPTEMKEINGKMKEIAGEEAIEILKQYNNNVPFVGMLNERCSQSAHRKGYINTILGRVCRFPAVKNEKGRIEVWYTHKAMNRLVQGSAADQTKRAMLEVYRAKIRQLLTVHDELGISAPDQKTIKIAKEIMETCVPLTVPSKVDVKVGRSWGEAK
jgi:DNA polymerase I-like protein with 3'-5' exonuclease and polymerase domains